MSESPRIHRVEDLIHRTLADCLQKSVKDPRLALATISGVKVSRNLSNAKIYISFLEEATADTAIKALNRAKGFFRREIAAQCALRITPDLQFIYDNTTEQAIRLTQRLEKKQ